MKNKFLKIIFSNKNFVNRAKNKFISRMSMLFMNMDEMLGADYEVGLEQLKAILENNLLTHCNPYVCHNTLDFSTL